MYTQTSSKIVPLTRLLAEDFATMRGTPGERILSNRRILNLQSKYEEGAFHTPHWARATMGGVTYRVNGQHSSRMLVGLNGSFPKDMTVHLMDFSCDRVEDLADLFSQFDARDSARTFSDILTSHARIHSDLDDISPTLIGKTVSGLSFALGVNKKVMAEERARLVHSHRDFIIWAAPFIKSRATDRAPVVGAMFDTRNKSVAGADEFWTLVRDESHPDSKHPSRTLARFLVESIVTEKEHRGAKKWSSESFYNKCIHAWNAYRGGGTTQLKCYRTDLKPKIK